MNYKLFFISLATLAIIFIGAYAFIIMRTQDEVAQPLPTVSVSNFDECVAAGYPVLESYPRQCNSKDKHFTEYIGNVIEKQDLVVVESPTPNQQVSSKFTITGKARGYWYFEASFPIVITDDKGNNLYSSFVQADGEWMTENFVPFTKEVELVIPTGVEKGFIKLHKDNPSGLPEHDDVVIIPINF